MPSLQSKAGHSQDHSAAHTAAAWGFQVHEDGTETLVEVEKDTFPDASWAGVGGGGGTKLPHWARSFSKCEVSRQPSPGLCLQEGGNMKNLPRGSTGSCQRKAKYVHNPGEDTLRVGSWGNDSGGKNSCFQSGRADRLPAGLAPEPSHEGLVGLPSVVGEGHSGESPEDKGLVRMAGGRRRPQGRG